MHLITESLANLQRKFCCCELKSECLQIRDSLNNLTDADLGFVFFALLNVDAILKEKIFTMESSSNLHKLCRFYTDLQRTFVHFFTHSEMSTASLVLKCKELYILS